MKITVSIERDRGALRRWWRKRLCTVFGHPRFEVDPPPSDPIERLFTLTAFHDPKAPRCIRCRAVDPSYERAPLRFEFPPLEDLESRAQPLGPTAVYHPPELKTRKPEGPAPGQYLW